MCGGGGSSSAPAPAPAPTVVQAAPAPPRPTQADVFDSGQNLSGYAPFTLSGQTFYAPRRSTDIPGITEMAYGLTRDPIDFPEQQLAGFTPDQMRSFEMGRAGVGSYEPFLTGGATATGLAGLGMLGAEGRTGDIASSIPGQVTPGQQEAFQAAQEARLASMAGMSGLAGTGGMYDPSMARPFMNEFEDAAVQQALADIRREGDIAGIGLRAGAVGSGAFGGSRQAIAEQELQRNIMEQQGRTAAQMRQAGFESSAQRSQAAFEEAMRRQQQAATGIGSLGVQGAQAAGNLGLQGSQLGLAGVQAGLGAEQQRAGINQMMGGMGQQFAGLGGQLQQQQLQDINTLGSLGRQQQQQDQAALDVAFANQYQQATMPFQQLAFASDIISGAPSGQSGVSLISQQMPQPASSFSQQLGTGLGIAGLVGNMFS